MSFNDIISFFLYVIPGFISTEIYRAKYPGKKDSDFSQITWSVVISILLIIVATWIDGCFKWNLFPKNVSFPKFQTIAVLMVLAFLLAYLRIAKRKLTEKHQWLKLFKVKPLAIWPLVNNISVPQWACVTLTDGSKYLGWIKEWTYDPNDTDQDFLLSDAQKIDEKFNTIYEIDGQGVYLRTSWVVSIEFFKGQESQEATNQVETVSQEAAPAKENL
jgi:hypothetical protein